MAHKLILRASFTIALLLAFSAAALAADLSKDEAQIWNA
jgi:hypothetical protein